MNGNNKILFLVNINYEYQTRVKFINSNDPDSDSNKIANPDCVSISSQIF